ncbi:MAG: 16S rRNA (guanine(527)-N(7))-methyltransferase RsmG [Pseudomonadota bacterium]
MTPEQFASESGIHPDSLADYQIWAQQLRKWNKTINLVAPKSLPDFWSRHALDSAQIVPHIPDNTKTIADFGSGAGFPALSIAIAAKYDAPDRTVHMLESAGKKASFLKSVSRETGVKTVIHAKRIEAVDPLEANVITARAFAPLHRLLPMAARHLMPEGQLVLLKGERVDEEIQEAERDWTFEAEKLSSFSDEGGSILILRNLHSVSRET